MRLSQKKSIKPDTNRMLWYQFQIYKDFYFEQTWGKYSFGINTIHARVDTN